MGLYRPGRIFLFLTVSFFFVFFMGVQAPAQEKTEAEDARKVFDIIDRLLREQSQAPSHPPGPVVLTERELNAYIAQRIIIDKEEMLKALQLKLFEDNRIEGRIFIELKGYNFPSFLRPEMNLYFGGRLEINEGLVRLNMTDLFLEGQRIQLQLLDAVIALGARIQNLEVTSIDDWYSLPYGIRNLKTEPGRVTFYFHE